MLDLIKPLLRSFKYNWLYSLSVYKASKFDRSIPESPQLPVSFIIGCGRSGTTILGKIISQHPQVSYLFEPYHLWSAIDPKADALNLYNEIDAHLFMDKSDLDEASKMKFYGLFVRPYLKCKNSKIIVEKTPLNAFRIGYLNSLVPSCKYIHIVRDGLDACASAARLAKVNAYKIFGKPTLNQWWGVNHAKWKAMTADAVSRGYYVEEISKLDDDLSMAALEWLLTLNEIERWQDILGARLMEINYNNLINQPQNILSSVCEFLEIYVSSSWLENSITQLKSYNQQTNVVLRLPPNMCNDFNLFQEKYGFSNRAFLL